MRENNFKNALLNPSSFPVTWELVPGRGAREAAQEKVLAYARQAAEGEKIANLFGNCNYYTKLLSKINI